MNKSASGRILAGMLGLGCVLGGCRKVEKAGDGADRGGRPKGRDAPTAVHPLDGGNAGEVPSKLARKEGRQPDGRKAPPPQRADVSVAVPVPGKPGYVFNPFTNNPVDVRGIPPGTLVRDPQDADRSHRFRVPEGVATPAQDGENGGLTEIPVPEIP